MRRPPRVHVASFLLLTLVLIALPGCLVSPARADLMVVGNDQKVVFDAVGQPVLRGARQGHDLDRGSRQPREPTIVANLPLMNSIFGPPTNLAITPDEQLAIVANSMDWAKDGAALEARAGQQALRDRPHGRARRQIATVEVGKQPSGLSINRAGDLALIANRADNSISVLVDPGQGGQADRHGGDRRRRWPHVVFTPDGKRALAAQVPGAQGRAAGDRRPEGHLRHKLDMPVGLWPYNLDVTPDGKLALTADNGNAGGSDGNVDTVSVIDLEADPPRVIDKVVVGDAPEGFAISPTGKLAVAVLLRRRERAKNAWFYTTATAASWC